MTAVEEEIQIKGGEREKEVGGEREGGGERDRERRAGSYPHCHGSICLMARCPAFKCFECQIPKENSFLFNLTVRGFLKACGSRNKRGISMSFKTVRLHYLLTSFPN